MRTRLAPNPIRRSRLVVGAVPVLLVLGLSFVVWVGMDMGAVAGKDRPGEVRMPVNHAVLTEDDVASPDADTGDGSVAGQQAEAPLDVEMVPGADAAAKAETSTGEGTSASTDKADARKGAAGSKAATASASAGKTPSAGTITGIRMLQAAGAGEPSSGATLLAELSQKADRTTWFYLPESGRLIIDIHGRRTTVGPPVYRFETGPVKHVVIGEHPDRLRLAVVLRAPLPHSVKPTLKPVADGLNIFLPAP